MLSRALLQEARRRAGLSQRELAERAGTSQAAVARIEGGRQVPSLETLDRLLRACDLELRVALKEGDDSQDAAIERSLALTPADRLAQLEAAVEFLAEARANAADG